MEERPRVGARLILTEIMSSLSLRQLKQLTSEPFVPCLENARELCAKNGTVFHEKNANNNEEKNEKKRKKKRKKWSNVGKRRKGGVANAEEAERQYWAESIVGARLSFEYCLLFHVKWEGYETRHNTWQSARDLQDCHLLYEHFFREENRRNGCEDHVLYERQDLKQLNACLKSVVTCDEEVDIGFLLQLLRHPSRDFDRSQSQVRALKRQLEPLLAATRRQLQLKDTDIWPTRLLVQHVTQKLQIAETFGSLREMFEFFHKRRQQLKELKDWTQEVNQQIREKGFQEDAIEVENWFDLEVPPPLEYLNKYQIHPHVVLESSRLRTCECACLDSCRKNRSCVCALLLYNDNKRFKTSNVVYECNEKCKCDDTCPNRRVQKGRRSLLTVFRTEGGRGWGVLTRQKISYKEYVMEYVGQLISSLQTSARDATYFFNLDQEFCGQTLFVDGKHKGNVTRFANHSCQPNLDVHLVRVSPQELVPRIAFFANQTIAAFQELTYDYKTRTLATDRFGHYSDEISQDSGYSSNSSSRDLTSVKCLCGHQKCKGII